MLYLGFRVCSWSQMLMTFCNVCCTYNSVMGRCTCCPYDTQYIVHMQYPCPLICDRVLAMAVATLIMMLPTINYPMHEQPSINGSSCVQDSMDGLLPEFSHANHEPANHEPANHEQQVASDEGEPNSPLRVHKDSGAGAAGGYPKCSCPSSQGSLATLTSSVWNCRQHFFRLPFFPSCLFIAASFVPS